MLPAASGEVLAMMLGGEGAGLSSRSTVLSLSAGCVALGKSCHPSSSSSFHCKNCNVVYMKKTQKVFWLSPGK